MENVMSNYQKITDQILAQMQTVGAGWMNPMQGGRAGMPRNAVTGRRYSGINVMLLGLVLQGRHGQPTSNGNHRGASS
jgi:antirestriction protein ArdC